MEEVFRAGGGSDILSLDVALAKSVSLNTVGRDGDMSRARWEATGTVMTDCE